MEEPNGDAQLGGTSGVFAVLRAPKGAFRRIRQLWAKIGP
jgi:hypothetical protein